MITDKIFDGLTHPSKKILENWDQLRPKDYSILINKALAVSLPNMLDKNERFEYIDLALRTKHFLPVVSIDPREIEIENEICNMQKRGCIGFKIHPRFLNWDWTEEGQELLLQKTADVLATLNCPLFFCTYFSSTADIYPKREPLYIFARLLKKIPGLRIVFLHSGGAKLLDYIEFARFNQNILLDLSYSPVKYAKSSYIYDLKYALEFFDRRISFGSDWPYVSHEAAISAIVRNMPDILFSKHEKKIHPVWGENLRNFLQI